MLVINIIAAAGQDYDDFNADSLLKTRLSKKGVARAQIELELARYYFPENIDSMMNCVKFLETFLEKQYDARMDAFVKKFKGYEAYSQLKTELAMKYAREAMIIFQNLKDYKEMGWLCMNLGSNYYRLGDYIHATEHYLKGMAYFDQIEHKRGIAQAYNELGRISHETGDDIKARKYFESALEIYNELNLSDPKLKIYNNLGLLLLQNGDISSALEYMQLAAEGFINQGDLRRLGLVYGNIAAGYDEIRKYDTALIYSRKALQLSTQADDPYGMISGLINLGYYLKYEEKFDSSIFYLNQALKMAKDNKILAYEEQIYQEFGDLYAETGDFRRAYKFHILEDSVKELVRNESSERMIEELITGYDQKIKDNELSRLRADQNMQKKLNIIFLITILLSFIVVLIFVNSYQRNRRQKQLLEEKNRQLKNINQRLSLSQEELKSMDKEKSKLFSIIAHDLRNPISAISGFAELLKRNYNELDRETIYEYIEQVNQASFRTISLLENLLLWAKSQMDQMTVKKIDVPVNELMETVLNQLISSAQNKKIQIQIERENNFSLHVDREMITAVLRNLVSNAIKFSFPGSTIIIRSIYRESKNCIEVEDHGTGIPDVVKKNLFNTRFIKSTQGTANETGSGLGLLICKDFTERNGGHLVIKSHEGKGSVFSICFLSES